MSFSYYDNDNNIKRLNIEVGKEWSTYKENSGNPLMNSVFDAVDKNSDGKVEEDELIILQKLLKIADSQIDKSKNNNIIEKEEIELLIKKIEETELESLEENNPHNLPKIINIPEDIEKLKSINYTYLGTNYNKDGKKYVCEKTGIINYSVLQNLEAGKYYIDFWEESFDEDGALTKTPVIRDIQESNQDGTTNWSEGINRIISKIQLQKSFCDTELISFLNNVSEEEGFTIELLDGNEAWIEDLSVVRADKKQLILNSNSAALMNDSKQIIAKRKDITLNEQGRSYQKDNTEEEANFVKYANGLNHADIIEGKTYLEGGNVLNTLSKKGKTAAVIGEESLLYTMQAMDLKDSKKSRRIAKKQIAKELGIKRKNVTYIPQFDFHIDMYYRPLNNGQMAIPDYEAGINVLKELVNNIDKNIDSADGEQSNYLQKQKQKYLNLISKLELIKNKTQEISKSAEKELIKQGYEIVKIPCFSDIDNGQSPTESSIENAINYMNGICGTSAKTGNKFFITNTSGDELLDKYMEKYFKETVGFDKVYFAPTKNFLKALGGIDCLTKEF